MLLYAMPAALHFVYVSFLILFVRFRSVFLFASPFFLLLFLSLDLRAFDLHQQLRGLPQKEEEHEEDVQQEGCAQHDSHKDAPLVEIVLGGKGFPVFLRCGIQPFRRSHNDKNDAHQGQPGCQSPVFSRDIEAQQKHDNLKGNQPQDEFLRPGNGRPKCLEVFCQVLWLGLWVTITIRVMVIIFFVVSFSPKE